MAKFVVLAREAFTDLVRGLGSRGADIGTNVQAMLRNYQKTRSKTVSMYRKMAGKPVPEGKVVVPRGLYNELKKESGYKKRVERSAKYLGDENKWERKAKGLPVTRAERMEARQPALPKPEDVDF